MGLVSARETEDGQLKMKKPNVYYSLYFHSLYSFIPMTKAISDLYLLKPPVVSYILMLTWNTKPRVKIIFIFHGSAKIFIFILGLTYQQISKDSSRCHGLDEGNSMKFLCMCVCTVSNVFVHIV